MSRPDFSYSIKFQTKKPWQKKSEVGLPIFFRFLNQTNKQKTEVKPRFFLLMRLNLVNSIIF